MAVTCPICGRRFKSKRALAGHMKVHKKGKRGSSRSKKRKK